MGNHFAFVVPPAHGHVNPTVPIVEELLARGHRVSYVTGPDTMAAVRATGATPVELPWTIDIEALTGGEFTVGGFATALDGLLRDAEGAFPELVSRFRAESVDAVCYDPTSPIGPALAAKLGVPGAALNPSFVVNENFPVQELLPPGFDPQDPALVAYAMHLARFVAEQELTIDLLPMTAPPAPLTLVFMPRAFQIVGDTFDESYRFIGPSLGSRADADWRPPVEGVPVLFVSLGTAFNRRPEFFRLCVAAFADSEWRVVMAVGDRVDIGELGQLPANVEVAARFPQPAVLRRANAFVSHAGMNSVMESLYSEVPLVLLPQVSEQALIARRTEELGLGRVLDDVGLTPAVLRKVVDDLAGDQDVRANLRRFRTEIQHSGGAAAGASALEELLG